MSPPFPPFPFPPPTFFFGVRFPFFGFDDLSLEAVVVQNCFCCCALLLSSLSRVGVATTTKRRSDETRNTIRIHFTQSIRFPFSLVE